MHHRKLPTLDARADSHIVFVACFNIQRYPGRALHSLVIDPARGRDVREVATLLKHCYRFLVRKDIHLHRRAVPGSVAVDSGVRASGGGRLGKQLQGRVQ
jgi:hypothetical protein